MRSRPACAIDVGDIEVNWDALQGWLPGLMEALDVDVTSQVLAFSETSFEDDLISPATPRGIYFGEDVRRDFSHLSAEDCQGFSEVLLGTKVGLPAYWKESFVRPRWAGGCLGRRTATMTG